MIDERETIGPAEWRGQETGHNGGAKAEGEWR